MINSCMRILILFLIIFFSSLNLKAHFPDPPKIFIVCSEPYGDSAVAYAHSYERVMAYYIEKEFPCAKVTTQADIVSKIEKEKFEQLMGTSNEWPNFCKDLATDYLIILKLDYLLDNQMVASAACFYYHQKEPIEPMGRFADHCSSCRDFAGIKTLVNKVSDQFVQKLAKGNEICPYKGTVNVQVATETEDQQTEDHSVYCNDFDGKYYKATTENKYSNSDWTLEKKGKASSSGTVIYSLSEETNVEENDFCYKCPDPNTNKIKEGERKYSESIKGDLDIQGLSDESIFEGEKVQDIRLEITFLENGTYTLRVKASSQKAEMSLTKKTEANGICNVAPKTEQITKPADVGINQVFGPFEGTGLDKNLSKKTTIEKTDPITKEKSTIAIDFDLKRE